MSINALNRTQCEVGSDADLSWPTLVKAALDRCYPCATVGTLLCVARLIAFSR